MITNLQKKSEAVIPSIKEALRLIGIKEITANIYSIPNKKKQSNEKKVVLS